MDDTARTEILAEVRKVLLRRVVVHLRLFLGVQMIEVPVELIEAVRRRQILVEIAEVVLAELAGRVAVVIEQVRDRHRDWLQTDGGGGNADLGEAGAIDALPGDEGGAPRRA